jgi:hypothetical protein
MNEGDKFAPTYYTSGCVIKVDLEHQTITLWLEGFDDYQTVSIDPRMPKWMLQPDVFFVTWIPIQYAREEFIPREHAIWGGFNVHPYIEWDEEELLEGIRSVFRHENTRPDGLLDPPYSPLETYCTDDPTTIVPDATTKLTASGRFLRVYCRDCFYYGRGQCRRGRTSWKQQPDIPGYRKVIATNKSVPQWRCDAFTWPVEAR